MNYESIRLEKGMYTTAGGFSKTLEELDPSGQYRNTPLQGLDAYQRQLKRFDIKVGGPKSDAVEKFFRTTDSSALFPEYVSRSVRQGMEEADVLPRIVAAVTRIDGMDYRAITSSLGEEDKEFKTVAEGAAIPHTVIKTQDTLIPLHKRGRMLVASYEALRFQRLDLFTVTLRQIGAYIARARLKDAVEVLEQGDGNANPAAVANVNTAGTLAYEDLIKFWNSFSPYTLSTIVASADVMELLLRLPEFKDAFAGLNFQGTGKMITPLGADLIKAPTLEGGKLIGLDQGCALELVEAGDIETDYDKLIDRQLERAAITSISGFAKIFPDASKVLRI